MEEAIITEDGVTTIRLTNLEQKLMVRLLQDHPEHVVTRRQLWEDVWGYIPAIPSCSLNTTAQTLRKKLAAIGMEAIFIRRGVGYSFRRRLR